MKSLFSLLLLALLAAYPAHGKKLRRGMSDWWSTVLLPLVSKYPVGYVLTWRHAFRPRFASSGNPNQPFPDDFMNFYKSPGTLFLKEIQKENIYGHK